MAAAAAYTENRATPTLPNVCPAGADSYTDEELLAPFRSGGKPGVAERVLTPDSSTNRVNASAVNAHIDSLRSGSNPVLPPLPEVLVSDGTRSGKTPETLMAERVAQDEATYTRIKEEYCYYEARYKYSLDQFLRAATSGTAGNNAAARGALARTKQLNLRLNTVLEVLSALAKERVGRTNELKTSIDVKNESINTRRAKLQANYDMLSKDDAIIRTQREMVRYTEEKNTYNTNQIALWAAANVVALGVIFYVYRT
jgi:hypothetical protein